MTVGAFWEGRNSERKKKLAISDYQHVVGLATGFCVALSGLLAALYKCLVFYTRYRHYLKRSVCAHRHLVQTAFAQGVAEKRMQHLNDQPAEWQQVNSVQLLNTAPPKVPAEARLPKVAADPHLAADIKSWREMGFELEEKRLQKKALKEKRERERKRGAAAADLNNTEEEEEEEAHEEEDTAVTESEPGNTIASRLTRGVLRPLRFRRSFHCFALEISKSILSSLFLGFDQNGMPMESRD